MPLASHRQLHPVRRIVGLSLLLAAVVALFVATWRHNQLADRIEASVERWMQITGELPPAR